MKLGATLILSVLFFTVNITNAQKNSIDNFIGQKYTFLSKTTGENQELQIFLPENYTKNTNVKYPVLYVLDGQNWFPYAVSLNKVFTGSETNFKSIPDFIVVGITTNWKKRRSFFGNANKKNAINFIENEVISFVNKKFRASNERLLFGWQFAGGFVINILAEKPQLFNGYLAATPVFFNPNVIDSLLSKQKDLTTLLFIGGTNEEKKTWVQPLTTILSKNAPDTFTWHYKEISASGAFGHRISPIETLAYGIRAYYFDYPLLEFKNVNAFIKKGGIKYVNEFYKKRAKRYGLSEEIDQWGKYILVRLALREQHFPTFNLLMNEFKNTDFIEKLQNWQIGPFAKLYLDNNRLNEAIFLYNEMTKNNPESTKAYFELSKVYLKKGNKIKARIHIKKAIKYAKKKNDKNLLIYKKALNNM